MCQHPEGELKTHLKGERVAVEFTRTHKHDKTADAKYMNKE